MGMESNSLVLTWLEASAVPINRGSEDHTSEGVSLRGTDGFLFESHEPVSE